MTRKAGLEISHRMHQLEAAHAKTAKEVRKIKDDIDSGRASDIDLVDKYVKVVCVDGSEHCGVVSAVGKYVIGIMIDDSIGISERRVYKRQIGHIDIIGE